MPSTNETSVQVKPGPDGNVTITIKLVIATGAPPNAQNASTANSVIEIYSDESSAVESIEGNDDAATATSPDQVRDGAKRAKRYSLRSRVKVEEDDVEDADVDWGLSQQLNTFTLRKDDDNSEGE